MGIWEEWGLKEFFEDIENWLLETYEKLEKESKEGTKKKSYSCGEEMTSAGAAGIRGWAKGINILYDD